MVQSQREDEMMEAEVRERLEDAMLWALKIKEEATSQGSRWPVEAKTGKAWNFPNSLQKEHRSAITLISDF